VNTDLAELLADAVGRFRREGADITLVTGKLPARMPLKPVALGAVSAISSPTPSAIAAGSKSAPPMPMASSPSMWTTTGRASRWTSAKRLFGPSTVWTVAQSAHRRHRLGVDHRPRPGAGHGRRNHPRSEPGRRLARDFKNPL